MIMKKPAPNPSRRSLLKSLAATGTIATAAYRLPEQWSRPVVDAIELPVHAGASPASGTFQDIVALDVVNGGVDGATAANRLRDLLIPPARAGSGIGGDSAGGTGDCELEICLNVENDQADVNLSSPYGHGSDSTSLPFDISITLSDVIEPCVAEITGMYDPGEHAIVGQVYFCCTGDVVGYTARNGIGSCSSPATKDCVVTKILTACKKVSKKISTRHFNGEKKKRVIAASERPYSRLKASRKA